MIVAVCAIMHAMSDVLTGVAFNMFPATVLVDGVVTYKAARAAASNEMLVVYVDQPLPGGGKIAKVAERVAVARMEPHPSSSGGWIVSAVDGRQWIVSRGGGCGCGSALKSMPSPLPLDL